ncbi:MAG TPA: HAMP domain-containing sensor histidine kinase [Candidatus Eisenbacteria bacterium]|nr:HAMP domain-containing sensor histidine kinase [Candidatus Eisenbacteria bacterium]
MRSWLRRTWNSYAVRLAAAFTGVGLAAAAVTAILVNLSFNALLDGYLSGQQQERQQAVETVLADSYELESGWRPAALDRLGAELLPDGGSVRLLDASGREVWTYATSSSAGEIHRELMGEGALGPEQSLPIADRGTRVGTAFVRLPTPGLLPHDRDFQNAVNRMLLVGGLVGGMLALGLAVVLAGRATRPVREVARAATALAQGQTGRRIHVAADCEFGAMEDAFNTMAETIEAQEEVRQAYASEVAHELRTPLMIQRSQLEAMEDGMMEPGPAGLRSLLEENQRLSRLVADLEVLGSAQAARFSLQRRPVDLAEPVRAAAAGFAALFDEKGIELSMDVQPVLAEADAERVGQVVTNLLSNALKHTRRGGTASILLRRTGPWAVIEVTDSGRGISDEDLPRVFERFYRGRRPRGRGSGIGLTVVRELVEAHGGRAIAESPAGSGALFRVVLPAKVVGGPAMA